MRIKLNRAALVSELALLAGVVEKRTNIPILSNVLLRTNGQWLELAATDLELALSSSIAAEVVEGGSITLPAKRLLDYVRLLPDGEISISVDDKQHATVKSGRSQGRIPGISAESFPAIPKAAGDVFSMPCADFARLLSRTRFAVSLKESRYTLHGALVEIGETVRVVATDGHRLALAEEKQCSGSMRFIITTQTIAAILRLSGEGDVAISHDDNHVYLAIGTRLLASRKLSGNFPDYKRVLPSHEASATINRAELSAALARAGQFSDGRSRAVRLSFGDGLTIHAGAAESGESSETVECSWTGAEIEMGFNYTHLTDFLEECTTDNVRVFLKDGKNAAEFRPDGDDGYRYVVMPTKFR